MGALDRRTLITGLLALGALLALAVPAFAGKTHPAPGEYVGGTTNGADVRFSYHDHVLRDLKIGRPAKHVVLHRAVIENGQFGADEDGAHFYGRWCNDHHMAVIITQRFDGEPHYLRLGAHHETHGGANRCPLPALPSG